MTDESHPDSEDSSATKIQIPLLEDVVATDATTKAMLRDPVTSPQATVSTASPSNAFDTQDASEPTDALQNLEDNLRPEPPEADPDLDSDAIETLLTEADEDDNESSEGVITFGDDFSGAADTVIGGAGTSDQDDFPADAAQYSQVDSLNEEQFRANAERLVEKLVKEYAQEIVLRLQRELTTLLNDSQANKDTKS